jgi:hypothetical protein
MTAEFRWITTGVAVVYVLACAAGFAVGMHMTSSGQSTALSVRPAMMSATGATRVVR